jgi:hypothetical protein
MKRLIPVLNYSTFYPGNQPPKEPLEILKDYDFEIVILTMVGLRNSLDRNRYQHQKDGTVENIIGNLPPEKARRLKAFLNSGHSFTFVQSAVIDRIVLDLFRGLKDNCITRNLDDGQYEQRIFDVLLSYNEHYYNNGILDRSFTDHELMWTLVMMQGVSRVSKVDFVRTGLIKHLLLLDFLQKSLDTDFIALQKSFRERTGLATIYFFIMSLRHIFDFLERSGALVPQLQRKDPSLSYLEPMELLINKKVASEENFNIGMMLSKPFFETSSGTIYVIDHRNFSLMSERAFMHLLFYKTNYQKLAGFKDMNGLLAHFGKKYYEEFLIGTLLKQLEKPMVRLLASDDIYLADFTLIVNETDVFVIEVKSVAQHYRIFDEQSAEELRRHVDKNYIDGKKGVSQLDRYITYIKQDEKKLLQIGNTSSNLNIYPVIVCTDPKAATYGINDYVGQKANLVFSKFKADFKKIMPLTMIQADFFVDNISLLSKDKTMLKKLIKGYHYFLKRENQRYKKVGTPQNLIRSMTSFDQYAIEKFGAFTLPQEQIYYHLKDVFQLNISD